MGHGHALTDWLTTEEIDGAVAELSADDLIEAQAVKGADAGVLMVKHAFNRAAARAGLGDDATTRVRASDFKHLAEQVAEVINAESPLPAATDTLLRSVASGE